MVRVPVRRDAVPPRAVVVRAAEPGEFGRATVPRARRARPRCRVARPRGARFRCGARSRPVRVRVSGGFVAVSRHRESRRRASRLVETAWLRVRLCPLPVSAFAANSAWRADRPRPARASRSLSRAGFRTVFTLGSDERIADRLVQVKLGFSLRSWLFARLPNAAESGPWKSPRPAATGGGRHRHPSSMRDRTDASVCDGCHSDSCTILCAQRLRNVLLPTRGEPARHTSIPSCARFKCCVMVCDMLHACLRGEGTGGAARASEPAE